jgi:hypothetical protein
MNLGTHMPGGERRKPIDIEDRRTKIKVTTSKNRIKIWVCVKQIAKSLQMTMIMQSTAP